MSVECDIVVVIVLVVVVIVMINADTTESTFWLSRHFFSVEDVCERVTMGPNGLRRLSCPTTAWLIIRIVGKINIHSLATNTLSRHLPQRIFHLWNISAGNFCQRCCHQSKLDEIGSRKLAQPFCSSRVRWFPSCLFIYLSYICAMGLSTTKTHTLTHSARCQWLVAKRETSEYFFLLIVDSFHELILLQFTKRSCWCKLEKLLWNLFSIQNHSI